MTAPDIHEPSGRYRAHPVRAVLWWTAAAQRDVLEHPLSAGNRLFYDALGMTVVVAAVADGLIGAATASNFIFRGSPALGVLAGVAWGSAVLVLDRMLLAGADALDEGNTGRKRAIAAFRIIAAAIIASANAVPAELALFKSRIDVQVVENRAAQVAHVERLLDASYSDIPQLVQRRNALRQEIAAADQAANVAAQAMIAENDGTGGSRRRGNGVVHQEKRAEFERLRAEAVRTRSENNQLITDLDHQIRGREGQRRHELDDAARVIGASNDPLTRLEALADLRADPRHGPYVRAAGWMFLLVALLFGIGPVLAKLLRSPSEYDALVGARRAAARAEWRARIEISSTKLAADIQEHRTREAARVHLYDRLAQEGAEEAAASPQARRWKEAIAKDLLRSVAAARKAAREAYDPGEVAEDIRQAARAARRRQSWRILRTEQRQARRASKVDAAVQWAKNLRRPAQLKEELH